MKLPETAQVTQLSAYMNTSQEANTSLSTEVCHYYVSKMELAVCIQCVCREPNGFATKRKWKINLYLRVKPSFIGFGNGHELQTGIWTWKSEQKLLSSDWKVGATKIENTLHRCPSKWLLKNTWNSVSLRKQRVPQGDVHFSKTGRCLSQLGCSAAGFLQWSLACGECEGDVLILLYLKWLSAPCENSLQLNLSW